MTIISEYKLGYRYSVIWLVFWLFVFLPVGIALLLTGAQFKNNMITYQINYGGSRFWLCFWGIVFFPIGIVLGFLNGFSLVKEQGIVERHAHVHGPDCNH